MDIVLIKCPNCGGNIERQKGEYFSKCPYCGAEVCFDEIKEEAQLGVLKDKIDILEKNGRECGCGRRGCLECYCSGTGIARSALEKLAISRKPSVLREKLSSAIEAKDVHFAAQEGDELALEIMADTGRRLGEACANFAAFSSPEAFIFFGGPTKAGELLMSHIRNAYDENVLFVYKGKAKILLSELDGASAAVLGASALGWEI